ncbi:MAG: hypothetical protein LBG69_05445 [Zoogloeaceae bacterium]|jgi:hypothetical protein|nr:hypothetical protein [Zoogloeaceae bacterium]
MNAPPLSSPLLNRPSVIHAVAGYLSQINTRGYCPDPRKALWVRKADRCASVRDAGVPVWGEVFYYIEGELFPLEGQTRLRNGQSPIARAEELIADLWEDLWVWNAYDFARSTSGWAAP